MLAAIAAEFGLAPDVEVTTEANPDSVALWDLEELRQVGFDRISFGMQSDVPHVLATLDRTHDPLRVPAVVGWARQAGFEQVSLDLIYGTPGESLADWETSLDAALACAPEHVSAYSLIVEEGTALARRIARGELPAPDDDDLADKYVLADERLTKAGLGWYEVSNWARDERSRCRHNLGYWTGADWWGVGPGAHSHVGGVRWWNVKHPAAYAERISSQRESGARAGGARRRDPAGRAGAARAPAVRRAARRGPGRHRPRRDLRPRRARAARPGRRAAGAHHRRGGCSPTAWCATCCRDWRWSADEAQRQRVAVVLAVGGLDRRQDQEDQGEDHATSPSGITTIRPSPKVRSRRGWRRRRRSAARSGSSATPRRACGRTATGCRPSA